MSETDQVGATTNQSLSDNGAVLDHIAGDECLRLLAGQLTGRVAVGGFGSPPLVVPVNFVLDGDAVVVGADYGTKFRLRSWASTP